MYTFPELLCAVIFWVDGSRVQTKTSSKHEGKWGRPGGSVWGAPLYGLASSCSKTPASTQDSPSNGNLKQGVTGPSPASSEPRSPPHNGLLPASRPEPTTNIFVPQVPGEDLGVFSEAQHAPCATPGSLVNISGLSRPARSFLAQLRPC